METLAGPADLSDIDVKVTRTSSFVFVDFRKDGKDYGHLVISTPSLLLEDPEEPHYAPALELTERLNAPIYSVASSIVPRHVRGHGYGTALYLEGLKAIKGKGWLVNDLIVDTSSDAMRVWKALTKYATVKAGRIGGKRWFAAKI